MRIGLFSDYYLAQGDGTSIATHLSRQGLRQLGHTVYVFCPRIGGQRPISEGVYTFGSVPGFLYQGLRLCWPFRPANEARLKSLKLDVMHIQTPLLVGLWGLMLAKKNKIPVVFTAHLDMDFMDRYIFSAPATFTLGAITALISGQYRQFLKCVFSHRVRKDARRRQDFAWRMMTFFAAQSNYVIAPSQKNYDLLACYLNPNQIVLAPNGINTPKIKLTKAAARKKLGIAAEAFVVISTARHTSEKQIDLVIKAFKKLHQKNSQDCLMVLNSGPQTKRLKKLSKDLGLDKNVKFYGTVPHQEVFDYLVAADVFTNMCLREVASLGVLEAAASGLPLLLCDKRLVEPLQNGVNGYFVKDAKELAAKLTYLANNPPKVRQLGRSSRQRVAKKYSLEAHAKALQALYNQITLPG